MTYNVIMTREASNTYILSLYLFSVGPLITKSDNSKTEFDGSRCRVPNTLLISLALGFLDFFQTLDIAIS